ncbi:hypothetical protein GJ744_002574 [Endocarpon pusillum]|uniref:Uncharacterized protein n=1 Tax=Endocarpon pusillum TaxID=364733 RepID=A0A8H7ABQ3_9EURO|nr:hypothetical protein GJ744_002574 [Endocarpon pusillum]
MEPSLDRRYRLGRRLHPQDCFGYAAIRSRHDHILIPSPTTFKITTIELLVISILLLAVFLLYMSYQVRRQKPAIIPNKLWRNVRFTATCKAVFFCWASLNAIENDKGGAKRFNDHSSPKRGTGITFLTGSVFFPRPLTLFTILQPQNQAQ